MISFKQTGDFKKTNKYLHRIYSMSFSEILRKYAQDGVNALSKATPIESGETANSWAYEIIKKRNQIKIVWKNSNIVDGVPIAVILQYGHATRNGGYVQGIDYINPAIRPIFNKISSELWREMTKD